MNVDALLTRPPGAWKTAATAILAAVFVLATGCSTVRMQQVHSSAEHSSIGLEGADLEEFGMAFITPSTVTGQEQDKQALAFLFADVMSEERPDIPVVSLPETLSAVNRAGIAEAYKDMYADYQNTGIFKRDLLKQVGEITKSKYLAQVKLSSFNQSSNRRLSVLGFRLVDTKVANVRVFFQIWKSEDGTIVWEGAEELNYAWETASEKPVTFKFVVEQTARNLIARLPGSIDEAAP